MVNHGRTTTLILVYCMLTRWAAHCWTPKISHRSKHFVGRWMMSTSSTPARLPKNLVVVIAGSTGVGKSDVAARLCAENRGIVVSADSVQAYPGVEIGANKPNAAELTQTPHILVDIAKPDENYNAAEWRRDALYAVQRLLNRNGAILDDVDDDRRAHERRSMIDEAILAAKKLKNYPSDESVLPVVVGGTMMYIQWLVDGRPDAVKPTEPAMAQATGNIREFESHNDWEGAVEYVGSLGEMFQHQITKLSGRDWYRLRRILEVALTITEASTDDAATAVYSGERKGGLESFGCDVRCFFLCPSDRMNHTRHIDRRCEDMVINGLLLETTDLALSGSLPDMAAKAIGYRQALDYLERDNARDSDADAFQEFMDSFTTATRRYAKRQMQWFRRAEDFVFVPVDIARNKSDRIQDAFMEIQRMISLSREEFNVERRSPTSGSAGARRRNEAQGKQMKTYQFHRFVLTNGSPDLASALELADECTHRYQAKKPKRVRETLRR